MRRPENTTSFIDNIRIFDSVLSAADVTNLVNGSGAGDTLIGGQGDDTYVIDNALDTVTENAGEGTDTVQSSISIDLAALSANVENLTLNDNAGINGTGNALNNIIIAGSGDNTLDGGAGDDDLRGGGGNDTYKVDTNRDAVTEAANAGTDTVDPRRPALPCRRMSRT